MFDHISKHREESEKYDSQRSILDEVRGTWKFGKHCHERLTYPLNQN